MQKASEMLASSNAIESDNAVATTAGGKQLAKEGEVMKVAEPLADTTAPDRTNVAQVATGEEQVNTDSMEEQTIVDAPIEVEDCGCSEDGTSVTWQAHINGEKQEIIIGFMECHVPVPSKKEEVLKLANKDNLLPVKYNLAKADLFWQEGISLYDRNGSMIQPETPNVYVLCPEPGTNCRIFFDKILVDVEIHDFTSVKDWAQKVGTTNQLCQGFDKVKEVVVAALATGDKAAKEIAKFSIENEVPKSVSEYYLLSRITPKAITYMMLGNRPKTELSLGRTKEDAQRLFNQISSTFGDAEAKKRYAIRAINSLFDDGDHALEEVLEALRTIPAAKIAYANLKKCGDKESCIVKVLTTWLFQTRRDREVKMVA